MNTEVKYPTATSGVLAQRLVFNVIGKEGRREAEILDTFDSLQEAERMATEYRIAYGRGWSIYISSPENSEVLPEYRS